MAEESFPSTYVATSDKEAEQLLERYVERMRRVQAVRRVTQASIDALKQSEDEVTQDDLAESQAILQAVAQYLKKKRSTHLRRFGRTFMLGETEVKWRLIPRSLEAPADLEESIRVLLGRPSGRKLISWKPTLDRKAAALADPKLLKQAGLWAGRHLRLTIKTPADSGPVTLHTQRYPNRK